MKKSTNERWLKNIPPNIGNYLAGFVDGEGSFNVSLRRREDHTMKWQVVLTFNVSQKDRTLLVALKRHLGCGRIQTRKDGVSMYVVSNPRAIDEQVLPFFTKFPFRSESKKRNFVIFSKIAQLVMKKEHLTTDGLRAIVEMRERLNQNRGRKRKWNKRDVDKSLRENPQRLHAKPRLFRKE